MSDMDNIRAVASVREHNVKDVQLLTQLVMTDPGKKGEFKEPGLKKLPTTTLFRTLNFELYAKPNKVVMAVGLTIFSACVAYIAYMNVTEENRKQNYNAYNEDEGTFTKRKRISRWD